MRRFGYWRDPAFILGCIAYGFNRWVVKPRVHAAFFHSYFNDLWLIPCALPLILWLHRKLHLRNHDEPPTPSELVLHVVFWSLLFEWVGPRFMPGTTGDPFDVLAYIAGAAVAALWWHRGRFFTRMAPS